MAGDSGTTGIVVNNGNKLETGRYWHMGPCADAHDHDKEQLTAPSGPDRDQLAGNILFSLSCPARRRSTARRRTATPRGLSDLGAHLVDRMMERKMIIDPDHLSVLARKRLLDLSRSAATRASSRATAGARRTRSRASTPRRLRHADGRLDDRVPGSEGRPRRVRDPRFYWGFGWGADMNGFAHQGGPREGGDVTYPFKSFDGRQTIDKQVSGQRI